MWPAYIGTLWGIWDAQAVLDQTAANAGLLWRVTFWYIRYGKNLWGEHCPPLYMTTCRVCINKFFRVTYYESTHP